MATAAPSVSHASPRRVTAATAATAMLLVAALLWPQPAAAASHVMNVTELQTALACTGNGPASIQLGANISSLDATLTVPCVVDLDLNGHALTVRNVIINGGQQLTIKTTAVNETLTANASSAEQVAGIQTTDAILIIASGTVTATGGFLAAGIGGGNSADGGTVEIEGGIVIATGGYLAAGIGGGNGRAGGTVTIEGGTVTATGGSLAAGIGGGLGAAGATVTIEDGTVTATGGDEAAGIGGGAGGDVTIEGGTVTATGGLWGAGIGGGDQGDGGRVTITAGTVTATGGDYGAGIGGGGPINDIGGVGGVVTIGVGAVVTASGGHTAVGGGLGSEVFGSLVVTGTLHLPTGALKVPTDRVITVNTGGRILGSVATPTVGAAIVGGGTIVNNGVIGLAAARVTGNGVTVTGNHYRVSFDAQDGTPDGQQVVVFADSFDSGLRDFADDPTRDGDRFFGWRTEPDCSGEAFALDSVLPGSSADGVPVAVIAYAQWAECVPPVFSPPVAPSPVLSLDGSLPRLRPGQASALIGGQPASVTLTPVVHDGVARGVQIVGDGFAIDLGPADGGGNVAGTQIAFAAGQAVQARMSGFAAHAIARLWLFSEPQLLGAFTTGSDGVLNTSDASLPQDTSACLHTLQVVGTLVSGAELAVNLGVWVVANPYPFADVLAVSPHGPGIGCLASLDVVAGVGDAAYKAEVPVTRGQAATMIARQRQLDVSVPSFVDAVGTTHADGIGALEAAGIASGFADGTYRPNAPLTRGQAASLIARAYGLKLAATALTDATAPYAGAISVLIDAGVFIGFADGSFRPDAPITRGQLASVLVRAEYLLG